MANAVRRVHAGGRAIDPELAREAWTERNPLSDRERQVLRLAADGATGAAIAARLFHSEGTVRNYLSDAISKLGAANRVEAAREPADDRIVVKGQRRGRLTGQVVRQLTRSPEARCESFP